MSNDSGNNSYVPTADDYNLPKAKRLKVSPHRQQNQEKECATDVIIKLNDRILLFCGDISKTIITKNLQVDTGKIERKLKRQHYTSILTIAHLRNARDLLKSALPSTSHQSPPADDVPSTSHPTNQSPPSKHQSSPSPSKVKSIMKTTETSPSMIQIQNMNEQVGVFISYIENVLINCNSPLNEQKKLLVKSLLLCADKNLEMVGISREIEHEFENNLDELADRNSLPLYLDDKQISEEEKELIRKMRQPINLHRTVHFLERDESVIRIDKRDEWNQF